MRWKNKEWFQEARMWGEPWHSPNLNWYEIYFNGWTETETKMALCEAEEIENLIADHSAAHFQQMTPYYFCLFDNYFLSFIWFFIKNMMSWLSHHIEWEWNEHMVWQIVIQ